MTREELIRFEADIAKEFEAGHIKAPVHLMGGGGQEEALIEIFKNVKPDDFCFSTHRSHYHALLKGIPPELVKREIMAGHSISLQFPDYHFFTSAIVGGIIPIALGVAMTGQTCWVFCGDMAAHTGIFHECYSLARRYNPQMRITFIIEDNGYSVDTLTKEVCPELWEVPIGETYQTVRYQYIRTYPHQGTIKGMATF